MNSIEYAKKFVPILDELYKNESYTSGLDSKTQIDFTGVNEVKILKISTTGLGDYSRATGYPAGDVNVAWETIKLTEERGKEISIDRMDNEETLGQAFGAVTKSFMRLHVAPELDAYRFSKYAQTPGVGGATGTLEEATILNAVNDAIKELDNNEVPEEGRVLYMNSNLKFVFAKAVNRVYSNEKGISNVIDNYNGIPVKYVVKNRFYDKITLNAGTASWGYTNAGVEMNFMLVYAPDLCQAVKFAMPKVFTPDENQDKDAWKFQLRIYHDAFIYDNKVKSVYVHKKAA